MIRRFHPPSLSRFTARIRAFRDETGGTLAIETVLVFPLLFWSFMAMATFFEAFRTNAQTTKASYVVADVISRELGTITPTFMTSMKQTAQYMTPAAQGTSISITMVVPTGKTDKPYKTAWSQARGPDLSSYSHDSINVLKEDMPPIAAGDQIVMVETVSRFSLSWGRFFENNLYLKARTFARSRAPNPPTYTAS